MQSWKKYDNLTIPKIIPKTDYFQSVDVELLKTLFSLQTPSFDDIAQNKFFWFILNWCQQQDIKITHTTDDYGNLYITKGKSKLYPCAVSHVDTVHYYNEHLEILNTKDLVFGLDTSTGEQHGIGADPKNGVYFILEMLRTLDVLKVVLFKDEEVGCIGSKNSNTKFFKDCSFIIQLDRRSFTTDIIEYTNGIQVLSDEFKQKAEPICQSYGYNFNRGTCTDVGELVWNKVGICAFNFSNGSFNEHHSYETCSIPHLLNAINAAYAIILKLGYVKRWIHIPTFVTKIPKASKTQKSKFVDKYDAWDDELWDKSIKEDDLYDPHTLETFIHQHVFRAVSGQSFKDAATTYVYEEGDEENIKWMYDYYIGLQTSELTLYDKIYEYLTLNFSYVADVKKLCKKIKTYQEVVEEFDLAAY